jgi:hypothetical protein
MLSPKMLVNQMGYKIAAKSADQHTTQEQGIDKRLTKIASRGFGAFHLKCTPQWPLNKMALAEYAKQPQHGL